MATRKNDKEEIKALREKVLRCFASYLKAQEAMNSSGGGINSRPVIEKYYEAKIAFVKAEQKWQKKLRSLLNKK